MEENYSENNKKAVIVSIAVLAVGVVIFLYYFYYQNKQASLEDLSKELENSQIDILPSANPLELTTPEKTPVEKTNPFKYENPFE